MTVPEPGAQDVRLVADDQVGLGAAEQRAAALRVDRGGRVVVDLERGPAGSRRGDGRRRNWATTRSCCGPGLSSRTAAGSTRHAHDGPCDLPTLLGRPGPDPGEERPILRRADRKPRAAAVRHPAGRLGQEEALLGIERRDPALAAVADERPVIAARGRSPKSERWKPFWPSALPWQPPVLQPSRVRIGTMSSAKSQDRSCLRLDRHLASRRRCRVPGFPPRSPPFHGPGAGDIRPARFPRGLAASRSTGPPRSDPRSCRRCFPGSPAVAHRGHPPLW